MSASSWIEPRAPLPPRSWCLLAAVLLGCGREDVELSGAHRSQGGTGGAMVGVAGVGAASAEDCSASVPGDLIGARPPLGWNGYNVFGCASEVEEEKIKEIAGALIDSGMQSAGYQYVNLDQCWQAGRSDTGERLFDANRLPGGLAGLASYLHEQGLSLGVFSPTGECKGESGGIGHEVIDAQTYAAAGVDYVKYVSCSGLVDEAAVGLLQQALRDTGRPMVLSLAQPPFEAWMPRVAQLWRTGSDAAPHWQSIVDSIANTTPLAAYARPGAFNDPDMLEIGNGALSEGEQRVQMSVWSVLSAPLLAGNDLTTMSETTRDILSNSEVIALNQDPLGCKGPWCAGRAISRSWPSHWPGAARAAWCCGTAERPRARCG
jgi:alpha-galactosidase